MPARILRNSLTRKSSSNYLSRSFRIGGSAKTTFSDSVMRISTYPIIFRVSIFFFLLIAMLFEHLTVLGQNQRHADHNYVSAGSLGIQGRHAHEGPVFHRIDTSLHADFPPNPKLYYTHSAGLYITFKTNSTRISAKWCTSPAKAYNNLSAIAFEGLDLYIKRDGEWVYAGVGRPGTTDCSESILVSEMDDTWKECLLYLPLYDTVDQLEIGVTAGASIEAMDTPFKHHIPVYGTSIVQGASASRPGLAYPARLSRMTGLNFTNMGISGSAKMEPQVAGMITDLQMNALIIDCVPNCSPDNITERTAGFIHIIRNKYPEIPIIAIEGAWFESGNFNQKIAADMHLRNQRFREEIGKLQLSDPHLYLIGTDGLTGDDHEGTIDGVHPNDLGFDRMIRMILPATKNILSRYNLL